MAIIDKLNYIYEKAMLTPPHSAMRKAGIKAIMSTVKNNKTSQVISWCEEKGFGYE